MYVQVLHVYLYSHSSLSRVSISRAFLARTLSRDDTVRYGDYAAAELVRFNRKAEHYGAPHICRTNLSIAHVVHHRTTASRTKAGDSISRARTTCATYRGVAVPCSCGTWQLDAYIRIMHVQHSFCFVFRKLNKSMRAEDEKHKFSKIGQSIRINVTRGVARAWREIVMILGMSVQFPWRGQRGSGALPWENFEKSNQNP